MKINKKFLFLSFAVMLILQVFTVYAATVAHEVSHELDYKSVANDDSSICIPFNECQERCDSGSLACYNALFDNKDSEKVKEIQSYTEIKAYGISAAVMSSYLLCCLIFMDKNYKYYMEVK